VRWRDATLGAGRAAAQRRCSRGRERVGTPKKCGTYAREMSGENVPRLGLSPLSGRARRDGHGGARPTFTTAERNKALAADGVQTRVRGRRREHARGPKGSAFAPHTRVLRQLCSKGHGGAGSGSAGFGARGKRSQRLDLASQTVCTRAHACACRGHGHVGDQDDDRDTASGVVNT
jgi:hypothetical protein